MMQTTARLWASCAGILCLAPLHPGQTAIYTVTSVDNDGPGSLRQAIVQANASPEPDQIHFNIAPPGAHSIAPASALPRISSPVTIDGTTQPGYAGHPLIELDGSRAGNSHGLHIAAGHSVVRGLAINRFGGTSGPGNFAAIMLDGRGTNVIEGNFIGTDLTGTFALGGRQSGVLLANSVSNVVGGVSRASRNLISGNAQDGVVIFFFSASRNRVQGNYIGTDINGTAALGNGGFGVVIRSPNNLIGGGATEERNIISGNTGGGILVTANNNLIQGNLIGTDASGAVSLGNRGDGITIEAGSGNVVGGLTSGAGNLISGNLAAGIALRGSTSAALVQGNFIGTDFDGRVPIGNNDSGIVIGNTRSNMIGGAGPGARNIISGNRPNGITMLGSNSRQNQISGNFIGLDVTGSSRLPNVFSGILINDAPSNLVGGTEAALANLISGNGRHGLEIFGISSRGNRVVGNRIGSEFTAQIPLPNVSHGILISGGASGNVVGSFEPGAANLIVFNGGTGVRVETGDGNSIRGNSMFGNTAGGIDLGARGPTPNDADDRDSGGNQLQNFPVLTEAAPIGKTLRLRGTLQGQPNAVLDLDFFLNPRCPAAGPAEGHTYLSSFAVTTDAIGRATFELSVTADPQTAQAVTATATDEAGNTSEFSNCFVIGSKGETPSPGLALALGTSGNEMVLTWPSSVQGVVLEQADSLIAPIKWSAVTAAPTVTGSSVTLRLAPEASVRFFRLRQP